MFDIRYHIASLVAVFLSLALGIALGTVVAEKGALSKQQEVLVKRLEGEYEKIKGENSEFKRKSVFSDKLEEEIVTSLVKGQLDQSKVTVVSTTGTPKAVKENISQSLGQAGAKVTFIVIPTSDFKLENAKIKKKVTTFFPEKELGNDELRKRIIAKITEQIATPTDPTFFEELSKLGLVKLENADNLPPNGVVFFAGGSEKAENIDQVQLQIIGQLQQLGMYMVGIETSYAKISHVTKYRGAGISTVDNIDLAAGQIAFIYVLMGEGGNYGTKPTAQGFLPPIAFKK